MKQLRWQILVVLVTLGIVAVLLFSQQSPSGTGPILSQPEQGGVYTEGLVGSLGRLNPLLDWNNTADRSVDRLLFSGLIKFDEHGLPQKDLADWGVAKDGTVYNFSIRPDAVWQDGTPVTSDDVIFTVDMIKSAGSLYPQD
ncbi:MAG TPA: ABC transporter substrate-binding protein, partial [Anaerolineales bacterium]|nr:ABC transporter substrate-binding protein [Anaerolineales bacterium]